MKIHSAEFLKSAFNFSHYPAHAHPEVAFAGRSNVGKSSLINALAGRKKLAQTSNTPGRTRSINFFLINRRICFVDLPGYGYARVHTEIKKSWKVMVEQYLMERSNLRLVVVIMDIRRDPSEGDLNLMEWLDAHGIPFAVVLTKSDKLSKGEVRAREKRLRAAPGLPAGTIVIPFSAVTGEGKDKVWKVIQGYIG
ncbi:MAG: ribosome biogenesis GTP-binding protein YihA/YsxC [Syntrophales bacterium]